jgi:Ca2+-transporting ATPase
MKIDQEFPYFSVKPEEAIDKLNGNPEGLSKEEARERLEEFGENKLPEKGKTNIFKLIFKQFKDFLVLILFIAAIISYFTGHMVDVYVIIGVILVNAAIGFFQEYKAEKSVESLKKLIKHDATVIRDGNKEIIEATKLVPGDILLLDEGKSIPADARIMEKKNLRVVESSLTGESVPVDKKVETLDEDTGLPDRKNMVFKGTHVARGSCKAVVTATGLHTELGKIAESLQEVEEKDSEFRKKTGVLAKIMAIVAVSTAAIVFAVGYFFRDFAFDDILLVTIATLVSSVPEGLPAVLSIVLAIGANRMAKQNAIIREFTATETAGSLNVILSDKTGTITQSVLTVKKLYLPDGNELEVSGSGYETEGEISGDKAEPSPEKNKLLAKCLTIAAFCNDASIQQKEENGEEKTDTSGDPTEVALLVLSRKGKIKELEPYKNIKKIDDLPFNSEQKFRASLIENDDGKKEMLFVGAPEKILSLSSKYASDDNGDLDNDKKEEINNTIQEFSSQSMRVIGCAYKPAGKDTNEVDIEDAGDLVFAGLFGIIDPPRPEVKNAVNECKSAGIRVIMVTGDHKQTATAIAKEVGILEEKETEDEDCPAVLSEKELEVDDETMDKYTACASVFARVSPESKLRVAKSLQGKNILIGMTGDGVNDAPALKVADVGIAMGQKGTDVARDASQIVLSDDNFASIVNAVRQGRIVFRNVRITSFFLVTTNFASTLTLIAAIAVGFTYPLLPTQILWINLVTDGIMDISLATEPDHGDIMEEQPLKKGEPILSKQIFPYLFIIVPIMVGLALLVFNHYVDEGVEKARTGVFLVVAMTQVFNAFNMRSLKKSAFSIGFFKNKWIILAFFVSIILQIGAIKLSFIQKIFHFQDIAWTDIGVIILMSSLVFVFGELYKWIREKVKK